MNTLIKRVLYIVLFGLLVVIPCVLPLNNFVEATPPSFGPNFVFPLTTWGWLKDPDDFNVDSNNTLRWNIISLFYPSRQDSWNIIYKVIRDMTLWLMIVYIIRSWASLLFSKKPENLQNTLRNFIYVLLWWVFVYAANRLFGDVFDFNYVDFTAAEWGWWIGWVENAMNEVFFVVLSVLKAFAFFLAIIMIVVTWIKVISAAEWEKWKKLVKWLINVVIALLIIKWIDFVYYLAEDSTNFINNASDFIINVAKIFGYIYGVIIVIMVFVAWYLYIVDGWSGSNFKKAGNILVNILLSGLVLFAFLLILYQVFAEFQTGWDAVTDEVVMLLRNNV